MELKFQQEAIAKFDEQISALLFLARSQEKVRNSPENLGSVHQSVVTARLNENAAWTQYCQKKEILRQVQEKILHQNTQICAMETEIDDVTRVLVEFIDETLLNGVTDEEICQDENLNGGEISAENSDQVEHETVASIEVWKFFWTNCIKSLYFAWKYIFNTLSFCVYVWNNLFYNIS